MDRLITLASIQPRREEMLSDIAPVPLGQPSDPIQAGVQNAALEENYRKIAPQYAKELAMLVYGASPMGNITDAVGAMPNTQGGFNPSIPENINNGEYMNAALQVGGLVGGPVLKGLMSKAAPFVKNSVIGAMKAR